MTKTLLEIAEEEQRPIVEALVRRADPLACTMCGKPIMEDDRDENIRAARVHKSCGSDYLESNDVIMPSAYIAIICEKARNEQ